VNPTVTCIMPTKDRAKYVPTAINCFLDQTFTDSELIVFNNGAPLEIDFIPQYPRIRYISIGQRFPQPIGSLRNLVCEEALGKIIIHWDDDDWSHPLRIAQQVRMLQDNPKLRVVGYSSLLYWREPDNARFKFESKHHYCVGTSQCYYREYWKANPFKDLHQGEDTEFQERAQILGVMGSTPGLGFVVARAHEANTWRAPLENRKQFYPAKEEEFPIEFNAFLSAGHRGVNSLGTVAP